MGIFSVVMDQEPGLREASEGQKESPVRLHWSIPDSCTMILTGGSGDGKAYLFLQSLTIPTARKPRPTTRAAIAAISRAGPM